MRTIDNVGVVVLCVLQLDGLWSELGTQIRELAKIPQEFIPNATNEEITLARHELENTTIITELSKAVEQGCIAGVPLVTLV